MNFCSNLFNSLNDYILMFNDFLWTYILIAVLIALGIYFTVKTNFVQFKNIKEMFKLLSEGSSSSEKGSISSFQAFCIGTASRVGTGNLAGVATAIAIGGPGAIFWMWLISLIGSASAFIESTLAQIYKEKDGDSFKGGPAYYMEKGLKKRWLGILFSVLIIISFGFAFNSVQSNTIANAFSSAFNIDVKITGVILTTFTLVIIFGGVHRIAKITGFIVPVMAVAYLLLAAFIVCKNITELPSVISIIFTNAFGFEQFLGGTLGAALLQGIKRGLFSNEAGMGSAPNAAATADVTHPVKQGLIQTLGVFTDTLLICSCTAFIILLSGQYADSSLTGIELTQKALVSQIGPFGAYFIAICILLFAFSSIVGNFYYGQTNIEFIHTNKVLLNIYRILVIGMVLFGSIAKVDLVWNLADLFMGLMAILNIITILFLGKYSFLALKDYTAQKKAGIKEPVFKASSIPGLENVEEWQ